MNPAATMDVIDDYLEALLDDTSTAAEGSIARHQAAGEGDTSFPVPPSAPSPPQYLAANAAAAPPPAGAIAPVAAATIVAALENTAAPAAAPRWVRVTVGADSYALELPCVQEVVRLAPIVAMRGTDHAVLGVMNLRGRIVPVFDLGLWLGLACVQPDERSRIVVVERDDELIGVLVSTVEDVVTLGRDRIEPPLPGNDPGALLGIARVGTTPTVLLDANALYG